MKLGLGLVAALTLTTQMRYEREQERKEKIDSALSEGKIGQVGHPLARHHPAPLSKDAGWSPAGNSVPHIPL